MTSAATRPGIADRELGELLDLTRGADSVALKLTVPESDQRVVLASEQQTKTRRTLEFFSARIERARVLSVGDIS